MGEAQDRRHAVVVGLGIAGRAVVDALVARGAAVIAVDDRPSDAVRAFVVDRGIPLIEAPTDDRLDAVLAVANVVIPAPGLPDAHPVFAAAHRAGVPVADETDLAQRWDPRPCVAITGTNGKTTVTTLVAEMLTSSGLAAAAVGNTDVPYVAAVDDPEPAIFVVESSSFRLNHSCCFAPRVAAWLNFAPDHLDIHPDLASYEAAKAIIWSRLGTDGVAVANAADPVVMSHAPGDAVTFSGSVAADWRVVDGSLVGPDGPFMRVDDLARSLPHDIDNALAAAACAMAAGARLDAVVEVLRTPHELPHRVAFVAEIGGVRYYDDSKATVPQATAAALTGFDSAVLIAGGRNKGLDLSPLGDLSPRLRGVVAIGEAGPEVEAAFAGRVHVVRAESMDRAIDHAAAMAVPGDAVILSPACASFDWYPNYAARGDDFARAVRQRASEATSNEEEPPR